MVGCWDLCVWIEIKSVISGSRKSNTLILYVRSNLGKEDTRGGMMILVCPSPGGPYTRRKKRKFAIENIHIVNLETLYMYVYLGLYDFLVFFLEK